MINKGNKLYSIFKGTCPRCHEEPMYVNSNPYKIFEIFDMDEKCSNCGKKYKIEPYFFYVSGYVTFAVSLIFAALAFGMSYGIFSLSLNSTAAIIIATLLGLSPIIMRLSRNIWLNIFIHYDASLSYNSKKKS